MQDAELLRAFGSASISKADWCHRLHVRVGYLFLQESPFEAALERFRSTLVRLNAAHGVRDALDSGYHESLTTAWLRLIDARRRPDRAGLDSEAFCAQNPDLLDKRLLRRYYSRARILSAEAKAKFVEPDLRSLPMRGPGRSA